MLTKWKTKQFSSLRSRLLLMLATILFVTQSISILWLWHESQEQVVELVKLAQEGGHSLGELQKEERETIEALFIPSLVQGIMSLLVAYVAISWVTRPLARLTRRLMDRSHSNLQPIVMDDTSSEITAVTEALNDLLARLSLAINRERQFSADVAHELRTPLAGIRLNLELLQQEGVAGITPLLERLDGLHRTVEQLLAMARLERNIITGVSGELELTRDVLAPMESECREMLARDQLRLSTQLEPVILKGEAALLRTLVRNLLENCGRYAEPHSEVSLRVRRVRETVQGREREWAELTVQDVGPGVDPQRLVQLTDAYSRLDSRGGGVGLGLNIVARICELHQAQLSFENCYQPRGLRVRVLLPLA